MPKLKFTKPDVDIVFSVECDLTSRSEINDPEPAEI